MHRHRSLTFQLQEVAKAGAARTARLACTMTPHGTVVVKLALATVALTTLIYIRNTMVSPEEHDEQQEQELAPPEEHQVEDNKPAPLPTTTEAMTGVGPWSSPDSATAVELARQLNAAEAKLAVREAELATERAARAAAERMAASALVAAAERESALQAITSLTASRPGSNGSDDSDGKDPGSPGLRWLGLSCDSTTVAPEGVAAGRVTPRNLCGSPGATPALSGTMSESFSVGITNTTTTPSPPSRARLVAANAHAVMARPCGLKSRSCGAVAAGLSAPAMLDAIAAATAPQLRDFKPQGLTITVGGADKPAIARVVNRDRPAPRPPPPPQPLIAPQRRQRKVGWQRQW